MTIFKYHMAFDFTAINFTKCSIIGGSIGHATGLH
jgi:hypothetical protein